MAENNAVPSFKINSGETISVVIPAFNASMTIVDCVLSVVNCNYPVHEVLVVDDVSTDDTREIVEGLMKDYPAVRLIKSEANGGPAKARNHGAREARGEYLFFLDSDTVMLPDALGNFALRVQEYDAVVGIYHYEPLNRGVTPTYKALLNYYFFSRKGIIHYEVFDASRAGIKREIFLGLGGFNEALKWGQDYENEEFGYRLCDRYSQYRMCIDPSVAVSHRFPDFAGMNRTYFFRVSQWMEIFCQRKRFESGGVTSRATGMASASLFLSFLILPFTYIINRSISASLILFMLYLCGYSGFFYFVLRKKFYFLPLAIINNIYFTFVIGAGAAYGFFRYAGGIFGLTRHCRQGPDNL